MERLKIVTLVLCIFASSAVAKTKPDSRKKIVVIDAQMSYYEMSKPYMCPNGSVSVTSKYPSLVNNHSAFEYHGINVIDLIGSRIDSEKYCIYHVAYYFDQSNAEPDYIKALRKLTQLKNVVGVNISVAGFGYSKLEYEILNEVTSKGIKVVVAAGNNNLTLSDHNCDVYPACLKLKLDDPSNLFVVGSDRKDSRGKFYSNRSDDQSLFFYYEDGTNQGFPELTGTSQSTAIFTGKLFSR